MAPVAQLVLPVLALAGASLVEAKPLLSPGRHAPPTIANVLSTSRRSFHNLLSRYYGTEHGLSKPPPLSQKRATSLPQGWSAAGCVGESYDQRLLQGFGFSSDSMSPTLCTTQCGTLGFTLAGTEYGNECYCGDAFQGSGGAAADSSTCSMACAGDSSSECGNAWYLTLYSYNASAVVGGGNSCATTSATVSVPTASASKSASASVSASVTSSAGSATTSAATHEDELDSSEWYALGCAVDSSTRILTGYVEQNMASLTIDQCLSMCEDKGYTFAGVEFGAECYCGSSVPTTITYNDNNCNVACSGDSTEMCGGGWALDLFELISSGSSCNATATGTSSLSAGNHLVLPTSSTSATSNSTGGVAASSTAVVGAAPTASAASVTASAATSSVASVAASAAVSASAVTSAAAESTTVPSSSDAHSVWAHHMVGNTYPYAQSDWANDISIASSYGIDGFALNIGTESWQVDRAADAYAAASGTGFKLFLSLDMTSLSCSSSSDADHLVSIVKQFASSSAQATHNGKTLVSTFAGSDCTFGTGSSGGWQNMFVDKLTAAGVPIFFVPSVFSDPSTFASDTWMDGELNWNSGWPSGDADLSTSSDSTYMAALGSKEYMPAISPFFFTHFGANTWNKNWLYRGDDWLYCTRWEQVIALRDSVKMTEILTWNDFGESSYIGPIAGALPSGSDAWVDGFDHTSINVLTKYYATAFKTGSYPAITQDTLIMWTRPHAHDASASSDSVGKPTGWDWTDDYLYAVVLAQDDAIVSLTSGGQTSTFAVEAGLTKLKVASNTGAISGSISRNGATVASYSGGSFSYTDSPSTYNYNYHVGSSS